MTVDEKIKLAELMEPIGSMLRERNNDSRSLNEFSAMSKQEIDNRLFSFGFELYNHVIYIAVLKDVFPENVIHWAKEIWNFTHFIFERDAKVKNVYKLVETNFVKYHIGLDYDDFSKETIESALLNEIKKANRNIKNKKGNPVKLQKDIDLMRRQINSLTDETVSHVKDIVVRFYKTVLRSVKENDDDLLILAITELSGTDDWS